MQRTFELGEEVGVKGSRLIGRIVEVKSCPVLMRVEYFLEFPNGLKQWVSQYELVKESNNES